MFRHTYRERRRRRRLAVMSVIAVVLAGCGWWWHERPAAPVVPPVVTAPAAPPASLARSQPAPAAPAAQPAAPAAVQPVVPTPPATAPALAEPAGPPAWQRFAVAPQPANGRPTIAIMIDDMGLNRVQTERAVNLPAPLTLSWMPYAPNVTAQAAAAAARGHETMLHMNMEALGHTDPGPDSLRTWQSAETNRAYLRTALDRLPNAVGLNQHEGSVASLSTPLMDVVMGELHARGMLFIDSLTIPHSVGLARARAMGVPARGRDIFLDNSPDPAAIRAQLAATEAVARREGHAIAIGHPRASTMDVLAAWLPTLASHGFVLWPVSATVAADLAAQASGQVPADKPAPAAAEPGSD